jgi:hypothetical protein
MVQTINLGQVGRGWKPNNFGTSWKALETIGYFIKIGQLIWVKLAWLENK